jgi:hypothetical protein
VLLLLVATVSSFVIPCVHPNTHAPSQWVITNGQLRAIEAIRRQPGTGRVLTRYFHLNEAAQDEAGQLVGAFSGKKIVSEGVGYIFEYRAKDPEFLRSLAAVRKDISIFYETTDTAKAAELIKKYDVGFIYLQNNDQLNFSMTGVLETVFSESGITVYKVRE